MHVTVTLTSHLTLNHTPLYLFMLHLLTFPRLVPFATGPYPPSCSFPHLLKGKGRGWQKMAICTLDITCCVSQNSHVGILTSDVIVLGSGAFEG